MVLLECTNILEIGHGKTVSNSFGNCSYKDKNFLFVDIPGTYSIMSNSEEEEIARNYICFENPDVTVIVVDATCLERNLNLVYQIMEITPNIVLCVNLLDEAKKKGIKIDLKKLEKILGIPVVGTIARKKKTLNKLLETIDTLASKKTIVSPNIANYSPDIENAINLLLAEVNKIKEIPDSLKRFVCIKLLDGEPSILSAIENHFNINFCANITLQNLLHTIVIPDDFRTEIVSSIILKAQLVANEVRTFEKNSYSNFDRKIDKILTSKKFGIPIMILFLGLIFWLTIVGSNYPSDLLFYCFSFLQDKLLSFLEFLHVPDFITNLLVFGVFQTVTWIVSVMLPPMAIFFPLFTFLEDLGYLPRLAFNMDGFFRKCSTNGKQMITMCMGVTKW